MGDLVDITTVPGQQLIYYKITSGCLRFQVKGPAYAGIGLASTPCPECDLWIVLGCQDCTIVRKDYEEVHSVLTPDYLSVNEFSEFWLQWHDDMIYLGRDNDVVPFLSYKEKTFDLKYITFAVVNESSSALQWRFEMPPLREEPVMKSISAGIPQWTSTNVQLPDSAIIGGFEKEMLYIIRAPHQGSLTPGKFVPSQGVGYISWGGEMHEKMEFEILVGCDCVWVPCSNGRVPLGAVEAGYSEVNRERLFVGRAVCNEHLIPGKVQPSHNVCYIPYDGIEIPMKDYEILVVPHRNVQCINPFFMDALNIHPTAILDINIDDIDDEPY